MGSYNIRLETYVDRDLADRVNGVDEPTSKLLREALRRELSRRDAENGADA